MAKILDDIINVEVLVASVIIEKIDAFFEYLKLIENYIFLTI